jgi:hypothetical protein
MAKENRQVIGTHDSSTRLRGSWLIAARGAWLILFMATIIIVISFVPVRMGQLHALCQQDTPALEQLGLTSGFCYNFRLLIGFVPFVGGLLLALLVFALRSDDWVALLGSAMMTPFAALFGFMSALVAVPPEWQLPANFIRVVGPMILFLYYYTFPSGRFVPRWSIVLAGISTLITLSWVGMPESAINIYNLKAWPLALIVTWLIGSGGVLAQLYRYARVSNSVQRQQTKWIVLAWTIAMPTFFLAYIPSTFPSVTGTPGLQRLLYNLFAEPAFQLCILFVLVSTAISILRYRLWDIDILIRRTLIYSIITAMLAVFYFAAVIVLQQIFRALTGTGNDLAIIVSTLAIAALFNPLRRRVQDAVDRRFYRQKYDAQQVLAEFAATVRDETDLQKLAERLLQVVDETMQPASVSLWLRTTPKHEDRFK